MTDTVSAPTAALGFLTVVAEPQQGLIGGYLLTTAHARPLEFHCTVPLRANRAQEILYGPTLPPFLYGEQIGATLVHAAKTRPLAVFTDCAPALAAAAHIVVPMWLVLPPADETAVNALSAAVPTDMLSANPSAATPAIGTGSGNQVLNRVDAAHDLPAGLPMHFWGRNRVARQTSDRWTSRLLHSTPAGMPETDSALDEQLAEIAAGLDLSEPFDRIRAAIQEAQRGGR